MKISLKKAKTKNKKMKNLFFYTISLIFVLLFGCNESLQRKQRILNSDTIAELRSKATFIINQGLVDKNLQLRINCIEVVAVTRRLEMMHKVTQLLKDDSMPIRFAAALAVGDTEYKLAKKHVKRLLKDPDENVRIAAAYAMGKISIFDNSKILRKSIGSKNLTVRANTVMLMGKTGNKKELKPLYWALRAPDSDDKVRFQAVEAIARLGDEKILAKIWPMLISVYADDRVMGIKALGALGTRKAREILITKLDDDVPEVRLAAAEQLGIFGDTTGAEQVLKLFQENLMETMDRDEKQRVRVFAAMAIGQIATEELTKFLPELLDDDSKIVRIAAAKAVFQSIKTK